MTCPMMMSLGVYVLGAADAGERARVEDHLPECLPCQAELARLTPLPGMLAGVPRDMLAPAPLAPPARRATAGPGWAGPRRRRGRTWRAAAAAVCAAAAAGAAAGFWLAPVARGVPATSRQAAAPPATMTFSGVNPRRHVSATAALTATSWGTSIRLRLRGAPLNVECLLIVRSRSGETEVSGVWDAWRNGPISVPASAGWHLSDIASLQVATRTTALVTLRATGAPGR